VIQVLHVVGLPVVAAGLPSSRWMAFTMQLSCAAGLHAVAAGLVLTCAAPTLVRLITESPASITVAQIDVRHIVFIAQDPRPGGGGGGGGNRQTGPIRHAEGVGSDSMTLRVARSVSTAARVPDVAALPAVVLDATPLASGNVDQIGLPAGGVPYGTSTGSGSGGGVGEGVGTGIGSGRGPGVGPGSGGGIGGGAYRPGGAATPPRVIKEVKPTYTPEALFQKIQGTVVLELVVRADGQPSEIRVVRSLDPGGLDQQAVIAIQQWRFEAGRVGAHRSTSSSGSCSTSGFDRSVDC
jgi:protein TonB